MDTKMDHPWQGRMTSRGKTREAATETLSSRLRDIRAGQFRTRFFLCSHNTNHLLLRNAEDKRVRACVSQRLTLDVLAGYSTRKS